MAPMKIVGDSCLLKAGNENSSPALEDILGVVTGVRCVVLEDGTSHPRTNGMAYPYLVSTCMCCAL